MISTLPGPEATQNSLETTSVFFAKNIEQMPTYEAQHGHPPRLFHLVDPQDRPRTSTTSSRRRTRSRSSVLFFVLGAKPKPETAGQGQQPQPYDIEVNFEVQKEDGATGHQVAAAVLPELPHRPDPAPEADAETIKDEKGNERREVKDLGPGKYNLVLKITDKVSAMTLEKKVPFEVK